MSNQSFPSNTTMEEPCWALVTGASRGIGFYTAYSLAKKGCNLILFSRRRQKLWETAEEIRKNTGIQVVPEPGDLRIREDIDRLLKTTLTLTGGKLKIAALSYGNPSCEPCSLEEAPWQSWIESAALYLASTASILAGLIKWFRSRVTVAVYNSFTIYTPHRPLVVADAARRGLPLLLWDAAHSHPGKIQGVHVILGSFRTPGAEKTVGEIARRMGYTLEEYWRSRVESLSPLGRTGNVEDIEKLTGILLELPEYTVYTEIRLEGGSLPGPG